MPKSDTIYKLKGFFFREIDLFLYFTKISSNFTKFLWNTGINQFHEKIFLYENGLTLKSRMPSLWNAHLALACTKRLGIFLPEFLQRVLHHQSSASNRSVWLLVWRRLPWFNGVWLLLLARVLLGLGLCLQVEDADEVLDMTGL